MDRGVGGLGWQEIRGGIMITVNHHDQEVGVAISGGLDSTIILHHLLEAGNKVHAYTMLWGDDLVEAEASRNISTFYGIQHTIIPFESWKYWKALDICMTFFDRPRWNVWPHIILEDVAEDELGVFYIGEGCDEIFGYNDRSYLQGWVDLLAFHLPTWHQCAAHCHIQLETPFVDMEKSIHLGEGVPSTRNIPYQPNKGYLWHLYKDLLPRDLILYPKRSQMEANSYYRILGKDRHQLLVEATQRWLLSKIERGDV